jgi:2,4-dienoyl-CoA reductase (NADPH2)
MSERPSPADPLRLAGHLLRNRIVATAHGLAAVDDGMPNDADAAYWSRVSRGGPGMVVTGGVQVSAETTLRRRHLGEAWHPWAARGFRKRADAIAAGGALPVVQLGHLGRETLGAPTYFPFEAPSGVVPALAIGDCVMPRRVSHALAEGRAAATALLAEEVVAVTPDRHLN